MMSISVRSRMQYTYFSLVVIFYLSSVFVYWTGIVIICTRIVCEYIVYIILYLLLERTFVGAKRYRKSLSPSYETIYYIIRSNATWFIADTALSWRRCEIFSRTAFDRYVRTVVTLVVRVIQIIIIYGISPGGWGTKKVKRKKDNLALTYSTSHCHLDWWCIQTAVSHGVVVLY